MNYADKVRGKGLVLITGKKGSGKSHFATRIIKDILDTNNGKYEIYANITGLKIDGVKESPEDWRDVPNNSIIFYDEAQLLPWADNSSVKISSDPRVANMTLIRKQNKHIVLMTQDPTFIHSALRKLVDYHYHLSHPFKDGKPQVFYFHGALTAIDDRGVWKNQAQESFQYKLDQEISNLYESIEPTAVHDQTFKVPKKIIFLRVFIVIALILSVSLGFWFVKKYWNMYSGKSIKESAQKLESQEKQAQTSVINQTSQSINTISNASTNTINKIEQRRIYLYENELPKDYEIRRNDPMLQIRGVAMMGNKCTAYNALGDMMTLSQDECKSYVGTGRVYKSDYATNGGGSVNVLPQSESQPQPQSASQL